MRSVVPDPDTAGDQSTYRPKATRRTVLAATGGSAITGLAGAAWLATSGQDERLNPSEHNVQAVRRFFELMHRKDIEAWGELWHEQGRIIVPYPPDGFPTSIDGRATILAGFRTLFRNFESFNYELTGIYPATNSNAVAVEYRVRATITGGTEYTNDNIAVFLFEGDLIRAYHDYFDPRRFQTVVDALPPA
jgi:ketosteroid isomerase-like protein